MEKKRIITIVFIVGGIVFLTSIFLPLELKRDKLEQERVLGGEAIERLEKENSALREEVKLLKEDSDYREEVARGELGLVKKNEIIYRSASKKKAD
ncbi:MAG: septum formation initiator family protein [Candidatus Omnitrophica bacterium]|nr:septum formation initiator family protein [Candidatus Omnitrophota bacterium]